MLTRIVRHIKISNHLVLDYGKLYKKFMKFSLNLSVLRSCGVIGECFVCCRIWNPLPRNICAQLLLIQHKSFSIATKMSNTEVFDVQEISEGKANVLLPKSVFYNPVQEFNRDLTISIISWFAATHLEESKKKTFKSKGVSGTSTEDTSQALNSNGAQGSNSTDDHPGLVGAGIRHEGGVKIFEGLAASGLRSIRFGLEVPGVQEIVANDFDRNAVEFIEKNITKNNLNGLVRSSYSDASSVMHQHKDPSKRFDVIDLDPYGSSAQFLDAAVQAVGEGGLLCITCTDAAVLCGNAGEACFAKYGSMSLRGKFCHEMALRILLHSIESNANRHSRYIVPLLSLSIDFYVRVFVRVYTGQKQVKMSVTKTSMVYHCTGCGSFSLQPLAIAIPTKGGNHKFVPGTGPPVGAHCEHCSHKHQIGGPMWSAPIHDSSFLDIMLSRLQSASTLYKTSERMVGMLSVAKEELQEVPLYYVLDDVCSVLHCSPPNMLQMRSALLHAGYNVSLSHAAKNSYKTNAPAKVIWDIMRCWIKDHPVNIRRLTEGSVALNILKQEPDLQASFLPHPCANPASRQKGLVRWQQNPEREWGPKPRARREGNDAKNLQQVEELAEMKRSHPEERESEVAQKVSRMEKA